MIIRFWFFDHFSILHTIEDYDKKVKIDGYSISGIDFVSTEARYCKLTLDVDDWMKANLLDIDSNHLIADTDILNINLLILDEAQTYVWYLTKDKISFDYKKNEMQITAIDLIGVMLKLAQKTKDFSCDETDFIPYLTGTINDIFEDSGVIYTINTDNLSINGSGTTNLQLDFAHSSYFTGSHIYSYQNDFPYRVLLRWRFVGYQGGTKVIYLVNFHTTIHWHLDYCNLEYAMIKLEIEDELVITETYFDSYGYGSILKTDALAIWNFIVATVGDIGFPGENQLTCDFIQPITLNLQTYTIETSMATYYVEIFYTGEYFFDKVTLKKDTNLAYQNAKQNKILKALLFMNNLYIYVKDQIIYIGNKSGFGTGTPTVIDIDKVIEYSESSFTIKEIDYKKYAEIFDLSTNMEAAFKMYYDELKEELNIKINANIEDDSLSLLDLIKINDKNVTIVKIQTDNDKIFKTIEGWG